MLVWCFFPSISIACSLFSIKGVGIVFLWGHWVPLLLNFSAATMKSTYKILLHEVFYFFTLVCLMVIYLNHNLIKVQTEKQSRGKEISFENRQQDRNTEIEREKYATCRRLFLSVFVCHYILKNMWAWSECQNESA